jgi:hypothetical protein
MVEFKALDARTYKDIPSETHAGIITQTKYADTK